LSLGHVSVKVTWMRKTFTRLDDALIDHMFQPASDVISNWIGVSRGQAACFCIDLASLSWIISSASGLSDAVAAWNPVGAVTDLTIMLLGLAALTCLRTLFRRTNGKPGNPLRTAMQPHRAIVLMMLLARLLQLEPAGVVEVADMAMLVFSASALYLAACLERPPVRRNLTSISSAAAS
jgi:hypothetical protein